MKVCKLQLCMSESSMIHHLVARNLKGPPTYAFNDRNFLSGFAFYFVRTGHGVPSFLEPQFCPGVGSSFPQLFFVRKLQCPPVFRQNRNCTEISRGPLGPRVNLKCSREGTSVFQSVYAHKMFGIRCEPPSQILRNIDNIDS